jgi:hypothetical protein
VLTCKHFHKTHPTLSPRISRGLFFLNASSNVLLTFLKYNQISNMATDQGETNKFAIHAACRDGQSEYFYVPSSCQSSSLILHQSTSPNHYSMYTRTIFLIVNPSSHDSDMSLFLRQIPNSPNYATTMTDFPSTGPHPTTASP